MSARFAADPGVSEVLRECGLFPGELLGRGGEASVYALDADRVLRIHRPGPERAALERRARLLEALAARGSGLPFALPNVLDVQRIHDRWVSIERRLPGRPLDAVLEPASQAERDELVSSYLECARLLCGIRWPVPFYGDLLSDEPIRAASFRQYLERRGRHSLDAAGAPLSHVDAAALARALPEAAEPAFVYLDYHPSNVLVEAGAVTAVVDFGGSAIAGELRFGSVVPATYLSARDQARGRAWLESEGLAELYEPTLRWIAAFWSFARDDVKLFEWCCSVLAR